MHAAREYRDLPTLIGKRGFKMHSFLYTQWWWFGHHTESLLRRNIIKINVIVFSSINESLIAKINLYACTMLIKY